MHVRSPSSKVKIADIWNNQKMLFILPTPWTRQLPTTHLEDEMKFILDSWSGEERSTRGHLVENAANPPHINRGGVLSGAEENIRRSVPQGHNLIAVGLGRYRLSPSQPKVRQLKIIEIFYWSSPIPGITISGLISFLLKFEKRKNSFISSMQYWKNRVQ